jgi:hypothetical protein
MSLVSNVVRRGAVYYFRRRVPPQIQSVIGMTLIRESLGTCEPKVARRLAADRNDHWERRFEEAEAKLAPLTSAQQLRADLKDAEVQAIVYDYRRHRRTSKSDCTVSEGGRTVCRTINMIS